MGFGEREVFIEKALESDVLKAGHGPTRRKGISSQRFWIAYAIFLKINEDIPKNFDYGNTCEQTFLRLNPFNAKDIRRGPV